MSDTQRRRNRENVNSCTNSFVQELCCEFDVTFECNIEDVEITEVSCGEGE